MKYRIIKNNGRFLLQKRTLFGWSSVKYPGGQDYESSDISYLRKHVDDLMKWEDEEQENGKIVDEIK